jgi:hypothetical protein
LTASVSARPPNAPRTVVANPDVDVGLEPLKSPKPKNTILFVPVVVTDGALRFGPFCASACLEPTGTSSSVPVPVPPLYASPTAVRHWLPATSLEMVYVVGSLAAFFQKALILKAPVLAISAASHPVVLMEITHVSGSK